MKRLLAFAAGVLMLASCSETFNAARALQGGMMAAQALTLSDEQVQAYVHQYITQLDAQSRVLPESNAYTKRLRNLTKGLVDVDGVPLNFKVYQEDQVNAFACADGSVRVYTGIMDVMTDNELLGVIGHEIGTLTDSQLGAIGNAVLNAQYSKKQESQADDYGYEFLKHSGRNPWGMAMSFEKLQKVAGGSGSQASAAQKLFSSHPDTETRIQRMAQRATAEGYPRPTK